MSWISARTAAFDSSGIRKVFDLAAKMTDPINLSIGQPDFDVPDGAKQAMIAAIQSGKNNYAQTQGIAPLIEKLAAQVAAEFKHADRKLFVTSGTSGALVLAMMTLVNPGDEVIVFDPYFVMYDPLVKLMAGRVVLVDTYPDFSIDLDRVRSAITGKTKAILFNSPANPTGKLASQAEVRGLAELAAKHNIALDQRRNLPPLLLQRFVRLAGQIQRSHHRDRRLFEVVRHDRLARRLRPRPGRSDQ